MMGFSRHQLIHLPAVLVALVAVGFRQSREALAWIPPSASMPRGTGTGTGTLRMSPSASSLIEEQPSSPGVPAAATTTTRATRTNVTMSSTTTTSADDYTHSFTTNLEARRRELEEANGVVEEGTSRRSTMEPTMRTTSFHKEDHRLEQAWAMAAASTQTMFQAVGFVANETVQAIQSFDASTTTFVRKTAIVAEEPITTYGDAFAKMAKSGRGVLKLLDLVRESLVAPRVALSEATAAATTKVRGTRRIRDMPSRITATLAVVQGVDSTRLTSAPAKVTASQVAYRPTISLSPAKAKTVWGYAAEKEEAFPEKSFSWEHHLKDMASNAGQWTEHVFATMVPQDFTRDFDPGDKEGRQRQHDFSYRQQQQQQQQQQKAKTAEATGPGPTYFLNFHDTPVARQSRTPKMTKAQDNVFFFAN